MGRPIWPLVSFTNLPSKDINIESNTDNHVVYLELIDRQNVLISPAAYSSFAGVSFWLSLILS